MRLMKTYKLFISHAWKYSHQYQRVLEFLDSAPLFWYEDYSSPEHDPTIDPYTDSGQEELEEALEAQISPVDCVIIISGMYVSYSDWIQTEIELALGHDKPIMGILPWGSQVCPRYVSEAADVIVGWNTSSIVSAIREMSL